MRTVKYVKLQNVIVEILNLLIKFMAKVTANNSDKYQYSSLMAKVLLYILKFTFVLKKFLIQTIVIKNRISNFLFEHLLLHFLALQTSENTVQYYFVYI